MCGVHTTPPKLHRAPDPRRLQKSRFAIRWSSPDRAKSSFARSRACHHAGYCHRRRPPRRSRKQFLASVAKHAPGSPIGLAFVDLSTGEFQATEFSGTPADDALRDETSVASPEGKLCFRGRSSFSKRRRRRSWKALVAWNPASKIGSFSATMPSASCANSLALQKLTGFGLDEHPQALAAAGAIVHYLRENSARGDRSGPVNETWMPPASKHCGIWTASATTSNTTFVLDPVSVRNLELLAPIFTEDAGRTSGPTNSYRRA